MVRFTGLALGASVCVAVGCGAGAPPPAIEETRGTANGPDLAVDLAKSCQSTAARPKIVPEPGTRQGSSVVLGRRGKSLVAYVADRDRERLVVVDVTAQTVLGSAPVLGAPEQVVMLGDGRIVAAVGNGRHLEVFEPLDGPGSPLRRVCAREVPAGPFGLAVSPDEATLVVTSAWEPALTSFDMSLAVRASTALPRAPRGVLVDARRRAFVTHLVGGVLSVVSLDSPEAPPFAIPLGVRAGSPAGKEASIRKLRQGSQAYALTSFETLPRWGRERPQAPGFFEALPGGLPHGGIDAPDPSEPLPRLVVPMVSVDPGEPGRPSELYYGPPAVAGVGKAAPVAVIVEPDERRSLTTHVVATTGGRRARECLLPRAVAAHPREPLIYVACAGLDELIELDARSSDPMRNVRRRFPVPGGPTGVAVAAREDVAVVFGQFDEELAVVPLDDRPALSIRLEGGTSTLSPEAHRGRTLFYRTDDLRITRDGMACSSCHPDGTEDALTWQTPDGPRQTIMLAGRVSSTAPFGWTRSEAKLDAYIADTCRRLGGNGLARADLDDLVTFLTELPRPPGARPARPDLVAQGKAVFLGRGCTSCHLRGGTDGQRHQLSRWEKEPIDTPSLRDVGRTAPYFHDGRYATLDALLGDGDSRMGATASLSSPERVALRAFLESL